MPSTFPCRGSGRFFGRGAGSQLVPSEFYMFNVKLKTRKFTERTWPPPLVGEFIYEMFVWRQMQHSEINFTFISHA